MKGRESGLGLHGGRDERRRSTVILRGKGEAQVDQQVEPEAEPGEKSSLITEAIAKKLESGVAVLFANGRGV
jgi:hypothetical protein